MNLWFLCIFLVSFNFIILVESETNLNLFEESNVEQQDVFKTYDPNTNSLLNLVSRADDDDDNAPQAYFCNFTASPGSFAKDERVCFWDFNAARKLFSKPKWLLGSGPDAFFIGGPTVDGLQDPKGGYAFFDVAATRWNGAENRSGWLVSDAFDPTDSEGYCLAFQYNLYGLGIDSLRLYILYNVKYNESNGALGTFAMDVTGYDTTLLWEKNDTTHGNWTQAHLSFASQVEFRLVFEAVPSAVLDKYDGYATVDNTVITSGSCPGGCIFEANFCSWSNIVDPKVDEFNWKLSRGTTSTVTGPLRDHLSTESKMLPGGYAYIDSSYPRRPGDRAVLMGPAYPASTVRDQPLCLVFWLSAFGPRVGNLVISVVPDPASNCTDCQPSVIWKLRPEKLVGLPDLWFLAQAILVAPYDFRVKIEASVGDTGESDIAIDDINIQSGVCPAMPSMASPPGDCTFDDNLCGYYVKSVRQAPYSPPLWEHVRGVLFPGWPLGHTRVPRYKVDYYMRFETNNFQHAPLDRAWLTSPVLTADGQTAQFCLTFWIDMFAMVPDKDGLGALQVLIVDANTTSDSNPNYKPVWRLNNHQSPKWVFGQVPFTINNATQVAFDGIEGLRTFGSIAVDDIAIFPIYNPAICPIIPAKAEIKTGDCYFDSGNLCGWTAGGSIPGATTWSLASSWQAPNFINDHTFGAPRVGFAFYSPTSIAGVDAAIAGANGGSVSAAKQQAVLESPEIRRPETMIGACFSFWFLAAGIDQNAVLTVADRTNGAIGASELLRIHHRDFESTDATSPKWNFGQVTVGRNVTTFRVHVYASGETGTFALDDITLTLVSTPCASRP